MRRRDEQGTALIEFIWLGLILLVPLVYLLLTVFAVQRASYGVSAASRAAGRAFVLSPDQTTAYQRAWAAARVALADQDLTGSPQLTVRCEPIPDRCLSPGSMVSVSVSVQQPLPLSPPLFGQSAPSIRVAATHAEPYGSFREDRS